MTSDHGKCPKCGKDLNGGSIWETGLEFAHQGKHRSQQGVPAIGKEAERLADEYAEAYGATREEGRWGLAIGITGGRTMTQMCPFCGHEWRG